MSNLNKSFKVVTVEKNYNYDAKLIEKHKPILDGYIFSDGVCVIHYLNHPVSTSVWNTYDDFYNVNLKGFTKRKVIWNNAEQ